MPFKSRSQMRTCFGRAHNNKGTKSWDCAKWVEETPSICCLPEKKGRSSKCRKIKKGEKVIGPIQTGPRGGKYFIISEGGNPPCQVKIYI